MSVPGRASISLNESPGDPLRSLSAARSVQIAALAYPNPSLDDFRAAADADRLERLARRELSKINSVRQAFEPTPQPAPEFEVLM